MSILTTVVIFLAMAQRPVLGAAMPLEVRADGVCQNGIYGELVPYLKPYELAQAFCSIVYPPKCTSQGNKKRVPSQPPRSSTTTSEPSTSTSTSAPGVVTPTLVTTTSTTAEGSSVAPTSVTPTLTTTNGVITPTPITSATKTTLSTTSTTSTSKKTTSSPDARASAWSKARQQAGNVISTLCSCIESHAPCSTKSTNTLSATTKSSSTSTSSSSSTSSSTSSTAVTPTSTTTSTSISISSTSTSTSSTSPSATPSNTILYTYQGSCTNCAWPYDVYQSTTYTALSDKDAAITYCQNTCTNDPQCDFTFVSYSSTQGSGWSCYNSEIPYPYDANDQIATSDTNQAYYYTNSRQPS